MRGRSGAQKKVSGARPRGLGRWETVPGRILDVGPRTQVTIEGPCAIGVRDAKVNELLNADGNTCV